MEKEKILDLLPYGDGFLFVDELLEVSENLISGRYKFRGEEGFYDSHFKGFPVTPGVILTECMAQIGLACHGIYLNISEMDQNQKPDLMFVMTSSEIEFLKPVFPEETVIVSSEKIYFRFQKLKSKVKMTNEKGELVCHGTLSGMVSKREKRTR